MEMSKYFKVTIRVHNVNINCNGVKTLIKDASLVLPKSNAYGWTVVETCRVINQWLVGTSFYNRLSKRDYKECKSCGELGTNLSKLFDSDVKKNVVYKSDRYKRGRGCSYFIINAEYVDNGLH